MAVWRPTIGSLARMDCQGLGELIQALGRRGYQVIGPTLDGAAISLGPIRGIENLPAGWTARQAPGFYRLEKRADDALFGYAAGPKSLKNFLHPAELKLFTAERENGAFRILPQHEPAPRYAFLGARACELAAAGIQDRVLVEDRYADPGYRERRGNSIVIAVNCSDPSSVCFCTSLGTGPRARGGFDLALTEILEAGSHEFVVEVGTALGAELLAEAGGSEASADLADKARQVTARAESSIARRLDTAGLAETLKQNFDHPHWDDVGTRCLACGNCTMVCPTCFCIAVEDTSDVTGRHAERWRRWDSCFTLGFSYIHGGSVRASNKSRYRQWLSHKLSYWNDQFGSPGCVGCGRCIAWCPVGIDLTEEITALRAAPADREETNRGGE